MLEEASSCSNRSWPCCALHVLSGTSGIQGTMQSLDSKSSGPSSVLLANTLPMHEPYHPVEEIRSGPQPCAGCFTCLLSHATSKLRSGLPAA
jgi:hypothetical protein